MVADKIIAFINGNGLCDKFQSGFRAGHSTETALPVFNDALAADSSHLSALLLLDVTAAFDVVDHWILNESCKRGEDLSALFKIVLIAFLLFFFFFPTGAICFPICPGSIYYI